MRSQTDDAWRLAESLRFCPRSNRPSTLRQSEQWPGGPGQSPTPGSRRPGRAHISAYGSSVDKFATCWRRTALSKNPAPWLWSRASSTSDRGAKSAQLRQGREAHQPHLHRANGQPPIRHDRQFPPATAATLPQTYDCSGNSAAVPPAAAPPTSGMGQL
jgi:hypothetical protein